MHNIDNQVLLHCMAVLFSGLFGLPPTTPHHLFAVKRSSAPRSKRSSSETCNGSTRWMGSSTQKRNRN